MFSIREALNALEHAGGNWFNADAGVGWNDPKTFWTPERLEFFRKRNAGAPTGPAATPQQVGGYERAYRAGGGGGQRAGSGYAEGARHGEAPRPLTAPMTALRRAASPHGRIGYKTLGGRR